MVPSEQEKIKDQQSFPEVKKELFSAHQKKQEAYNKFLEYKQEMKSHAYLSNQLRDKLQKIYLQKKKMMEQRNDLTKKSAGLMTVFRSACTQENEMKKKLGISSIIPIKKKIAELEMKLETSAMPFEAEKKLMAKINELRRSISGAKDLSKKQEEIASLKQQLTANRNQRDILKDKMFQLGKEEYEIKSQLRDEEAKLKDLIQPIESARSRYEEAKSIVFSKSNTLKSTINTYHQQRLQQQQAHEQAILRKKEIEKSILQEKKQAVEEKLRTRKKLTTEDLRILQETSN